MLGPPGLVGAGFFVIQCLPAAHLSDKSSEILREALIFCPKTKLTKITLTYDAV